MASSSRGPSDAPAELQLPQLKQSPAQSTDDVVFKPRPGRAGTFPKPLNLPDICKPEWQRDGMPDTEFYRKYSPDPWGEEVSPNARVWKIYRDQQDLPHSSMLEGWNKTLDVLLIFAGLFSAVLTAFLIESYKALQPDYTQYVAVFLYAAAVSHNGTGGIFPALDMIVAPDRFIQTSAAQRWTNGLWFASLVISLAIALLCILIKQWLDSYDSNISAESPSPRHWARRHKLYHRGLEKWGLPGIISFLPLLLHLSLFLFFAGLILFLLPLDGAISFSLLGMVSCIGAFYILSLFLPAWRVDCPSYTPMLLHALAAVSRAMPTLLYVISTIKCLKRFLNVAPRSVLRARMKDAEHLARDKLLRETDSLDRDALELDGYILSALLQLPTHSNRDTVNAVWAALPALRWSQRTIEVIFSEIPSHALRDQLGHCYGNIPWKMTGFAVTSHEQLWRAHEALCILNASYESSTGYCVHPRLGVPILPQALGIQDAGGNEANIDVLVPELQAIRSLDDSSDRLPGRSACLIFLEICSTYNQIYSSDCGWHPAGLSYFLLLFWAGRFTRADTQELLRALGSVQRVLRWECSINIPVHKSGDRDSIIAVANGLWLMLSDFPRYNIDTLTAQKVASETIACFHRALSIDSHIVLGQITPLSTFLRSPGFIRCVGTNDSWVTTSIESISEYIIPFRYWEIVDRAEVQLDEYWACIAAFLKWSCACYFSPKHAALSFFSATELFLVDPIHWNYGNRLSVGGPYPTQDDWYEPVLSAFLVGPNAIETWTTPDDRVPPRRLCDLAHRISIVLCRRKRLGRANDAFVPGFFSWLLLLALFRERASRQDNPIALYVQGHEREISYDLAVEDLARHCHKLSSERFMEICTQLEEIGDAGSMLRSTPGGVFFPECKANCPCMLPPARAQTGTPTPWDAFAARLRRGDTDPTTSSDV